MTTSSFEAAGLKPLASLIARLEREAAERFELAPIDLQADAQWMAPAPRCWSSFYLESWPCSWERKCFCHSLPNPAARDYRRRTKHRRRRQR